MKAEADLFVDEHAMLALVNDDALFPTPATGNRLDLWPPMAALKLARCPRLPGVA